MDNQKLTANCGGRLLDTVALGQPLAVGINDDGSYSASFVGRWLDLPPQSPADAVSKAIQWAQSQECEFYGAPATHSEFFDEIIFVCEACHAG